MEDKDLGIKIGTPREAWWTNLKKKCEEGILHSEESLKCDKMILKLANRIIAEEQGKMKCT